MMGGKARPPGPAGSPCIQTVHGRGRMRTIADVDGAPAEGEVVLAAVDVGLVPVGVEGHRARLRRKVEQTLQVTNSEIRCMLTANPVVWTSHEQ